MMVRRAAAAAGAAYGHPRSGRDAALGAAASAPTSGDTWAQMYLGGDEGGKRGKKRPHRYASAAEAWVAAQSVEMALAATRASLAAALYSMKRERGADRLAVVMPPGVSSPGWFADDGDGSCRIGCGWLRISVWGKQGERQRLLDELPAYVESLTPKPYAAQFFDRTWRILSGKSSVSVKDAPGTAGDLVHINITQSDCEVLGWLGLRKLLLWAKKQERWHASRLDLNFDDRIGEVTPEDIYAALEAGQTVTHAKTWSRKVNNEGGDTVYVGSRASQEMLRVYRGDTQHPDLYPVAEGEEVQPWYRHEMEFKGKAADYRTRQFFRLDSTHPEWTREQMADAFWGAVARLVDFRDRGAAVRPEDCPRLGWWSKLVGLVAKLPRPRERAAPVDFMRAAAIVTRQYAPMLAFIVDEVERSGHGGWDYLGVLVGRGRESRSYHARYGPALMAT
jgi:hypothetical protein